jgi:predicted transposase/invertase (TIGR01784 family)
MVSAVTTTPHDALFKAAFSKLRHARGLLRALVPGPLGRRLAWPTLRLESGIAVGDEDLDEQRMDLVYSVRAGKRRVLLYVLAEHQSKVDPWMAFRLLCYLVAIWKGHRAQHPRARKLPAILPIVVHHSPTGWTGERPRREMCSRAFCGIFSKRVGPNRPPCASCSAGRWAARPRRRS